MKTDYESSTHDGQFAGWPGRRPTFTRRDFLKLLKTGAAALVVSGAGLPPLPGMAGPLEQEDWNSIVPADKKLPPAWVKSLFARGQPTVYTKARNELRFIGMPVGGICCGTLYLSGDGRLWCWDIFNQKYLGILPRTVPWSEVKMSFPGNSSGQIQPSDGAAYVKPHTPEESPAIAQGFALRIQSGSQPQVRKLDASGWAEVRFRGQYPVGTVEYTDPACPVAVRLEAFSPFIPLNAEDSGLPATVMEFTVTNTCRQTVAVELAGWLQNACAFYSGQSGENRVNRVLRGKLATLVACGIATDSSKQTDTAQPKVSLEQRHDFGTMALALVGDGADARALSNAPSLDLPAAVFERVGQESGPSSETPVSIPATTPGPIGALSRSLRLAAGASETVSFVVAWHFPNSAIDLPDAKQGNYYAKRFPDAAAVANYVAGELPRLGGTTKLWRDTWNDSSLPHWFLDRTFANTSILATTTAHRFTTGRFWGWEGIGCCEGTCTHVWHYAQAVGRIFPELERDTRERVDFGVAFDERTGGVGNRGAATSPAMDGEAGRILGVWREHQMSADNAFLMRLWPRVRKAAEFLLDHDVDGDGIIDGAQANTLDAEWYGEIPWISSLAIAAFRASEEMALEAGETEFAGVCHARFEKGKASIERKLFNGEYFIQLPAQGHEHSVGAYQGCDIDQVFGQGWAWQVALGRVLDRAKTVSALKALWKYNFDPDVGPFRARFREGRPYALPGEAGLIMAANPKMLPNVFGVPGWTSAYFNECMSGFEHQAAAHMVAEGLLLEGLAVTRAIHDRYHASRRNPWNEIECSDHYARAMASYGTFVSICGFECHGPRGHIGFAPRLTPENFQAAFTAAEGWGTFSQRRQSRKMECRLAVRWGKLRLNTMALEAPSGLGGSLRVALNQTPLAATLARQGARVVISLNATCEVKAGQTLHITLA